MKNECIGYSSVTGNLHLKSGLPNQDAYLVKRYGFGTVLAVSDGMGSHLHSDIGSQCVCRSVARSIQLWREYKCGDIRLMIPMLHSLWGIDIYPYPKMECGATCLFAFLSKEGKLYLGQLGDGSIFYDVGGGFQILRKKEDDFSNLTTGINSIRDYEDWRLKAIDISGKPVKISVMTDGVSETLVEEKRQGFVELVWKRVREKTCLKDRNNLIYGLLRDWNPVNAGDDRTLVSYTAPGIP